MFLAKYGRGDLLDPPAPGAETAIDDAARDDAHNLASDLEAFGPTFIKLGRLLSTRGGCSRSFAYRWSRSSTAAR